MLGDVAPVSAFNHLGRFRSNPHNPTHAHRYSKSYNPAARLPAWMLRAFFEVSKSM
jgi:hypothetical protein